MVFEVLLADTEPYIEKMEILLGFDRLEGGLNRILVVSFLVVAVRNVAVVLCHVLARCLHPSLAACSYGLLVLFNGFFNIITVAQVVSRSA